MTDYLKLLPPRFWLMNYPYNRQWDEAVNKALDTGNTEYISKFESKIDGIQVWTENYPYAYGTPYSAPLSDGVRPSRKTILRMRSILGNNETQSLDDKVKGWIGK